MPWTQLFKVKSFEQALKPRRNLFHIDPILTGASLHKVKKVFKMTEIPFVWDAKELIRDNNPNSPYHKFPKSIGKIERKYQDRVIKLRSGIMLAKEKELKYRQESLNKRPYRGMEQLIKLTMPFMVKQTAMKAEGDFGGKVRSRKMVAEFVKEVPKNKNISFGRRNQERVKNLMEDKVIDTGNVLESQRKQKENPAQKMAEQKKKQPELINKTTTKDVSEGDKKVSESNLNKKVMEGMAEAPSSDEE
jgi:hypothetical protein